MENLTVMYKGIEIPATMKKFGNGISKLVPINTNRYTLYGIPRPQNVNINAKITFLARNIIRQNKGTVNSKGIILAKYVRKREMSLIHKYGKNEVPEYLNSKGAPVGVIVAFIHDNKLLIGWSKYLEGRETVITPSGENKVTHTIKSKPKEPLIFTKKDAMLLAIERGLVDTITFQGSAVYTKEEKIIPKSIVNGLSEFIKRCERYFKRVSFNTSLK